MNVKECESVRKWFKLGNKGKGYTAETQKVYEQYMKMFCLITRKTPDELAQVGSAEALRIQQEIAKAIKDTLHYRDLSITCMLNALPSFWEANVVRLTEDLATYKGSPWLLRQRSKRQT